MTRTGRPRRRGVLAPALLVLLLLGPSWAPVASAQVDLPAALDRLLDDLQGGAGQAGDVAEQVAPAGPGGVPSPSASAAQDRANATLSEARADLEPFTGCHGATLSTLGSPRNCRSPIQRVFRADFDDAGLLGEAGWTQEVLRGQAPWGLLDAPNRTVARDGAPAYAPDCEGREQCPLPARTFPRAATLMNPLGRYDGLVDARLVSPVIDLRYVVGASARTDDPYDVLTQDPTLGEPYRVFLAFWKANLKGLQVAIGTPRLGTYDWVLTTPPSRIERLLLGSTGTEGVGDELFANPLADRYGAALINLTFYHRYDFNPALANPDFPPNTRQDGGFLEIRAERGDGTFGPWEPLLGDPIFEARLGSSILVNPCIVSGLPVGRCGNPFEVPPGGALPAVSGVAEDAFENPALGGSGADDHRPGLSGYNGRLQTRPLEQCYHQTVTKDNQGRVDCKAHTPAFVGDSAGRLVKSHFTLNGFAGHRIQLAFRTIANQAPGSITPQDLGWTVDAVQVEALVPMRDPGVEALTLPREGDVVPTAVAVAPEARIKNFGFLPVEGVVVNFTVEPDAPELTGAGLASAAQRDAAALQEDAARAVAGGDAPGIPGATSGLAGSGAAPPAAVLSAEVRIPKLEPQEAVAVASPLPCAACGPGAYRLRVEVYTEPASGGAPGSLPANRTEDGTKVNNNATLRFRVEDRPEARLRVRVPADQVLTDVNEPKVLRVELDNLGNVDLLGAVDLVARPLNRTTLAPVPGQPALPAGSLRVGPGDLPAGRRLISFGADRDSLAANVTWSPAGLLPGAYLVEATFRAPNLAPIQAQTLAFIRSTPPPLLSQTFERACGDGRDNDGDGKADADDPGCYGVDPKNASRQRYFANDLDERDPCDLALPIEAQPGCVHPDAPPYDGFTPDRVPLAGFAHRGWQQIDPYLEWGDPFMAALPLGGVSSSRVWNGTGYDEPLLEYSLLTLLGQQDVVATLDSQSLLFTGPLRAEGTLELIGATMTARQPFAVSAPVTLAMGSPVMLPFAFEVVPEVLQGDEAATDVLLTLDGVIGLAGNLSVPLLLQGAAQEVHTVPLAGRALAPLATKVLLEVPRRAEPEVAGPVISGGLVLNLTGTAQGLAVCSTVRILSTPIPLGCVALPLEDLEGELQGGQTPSTRDFDTSTVYNRHNYLDDYYLTRIVDLRGCVLPACAPVLSFWHRGGFAWSGTEGLPVEEDAVPSTLQGVSLDQANSNRSRGLVEITPVDGGGLVVRADLGASVHPCDAGAALCPALDAVPCSDAATSVVDGTVRPGNLPVLNGPLPVLGAGYAEVAAEPRCARQTVADPVSGAVTVASYTQPVAQWTREEIPLDAFAGREVAVSFHLQTSAGRLRAMRDAPEFGDALGHCVADPPVTCGPDLVSWDLDNIRLAGITPQGSAAFLEDAFLDTAGDHDDSWTGWANFTTLRQVADADVPLHPSCFLLPSVEGHDPLGCLARSQLRNPALLLLGPVSLLDGRGWKVFNHLAEEQPSGIPNPYYDGWFLDEAGGFLAPGVADPSLTHALRFGGPGPGGQYGANRTYSIVSSPLVDLGAAGSPYALFLTNYSFAREFVDPTGVDVARGFVHGGAVFLARYLQDPASPSRLLLDRREIVPVEGGYPALVNGVDSLGKLELPRIGVAINWTIPSASGAALPNAFAGSSSGWVPVRVDLAEGLQRLCLRQVRTATTSEVQSFSRSDCANFTRPADPAKGEQARFACEGDRCVELSTGRVYINLTGFAQDPGARYAVEFHVQNDGGGLQRHGWAIDDLRLGEGFLANDVGITAITVPAPGKPVGPGEEVRLRVNVTNHGTFAQRGIVLHFNVTQEGVQVFPNPDKPELGCGQRSCSQVTPPGLVFPGLRDPNPERNISQTFATPWVPKSEGVFTFNVWTELQGVVLNGELVRLPDEDPLNDLFAQRVDVREVHGARLLPAADFPDDKAVDPLVGTTDDRRTLRFVVENTGTVGAGTQVGRPVNVSATIVDEEGRVTRLADQVISFLPPGARFAGDFGLRAWVPPKGGLYTITMQVRHADDPQRADDTRVVRVLVLSALLPTPGRAWTEFVLPEGQGWADQARANFDAGQGWSFGLGGSYGPSREGALALGRPVDLTNFRNAVLTVRHAWDFEPGYDGGVVEASVDNATWERLEPLGGYPGRLTTASPAVLDPAGDLGAFTGRSDGVVTTVFPLGGLAATRGPAGVLLRDTFEPAPTHAGVEFADVRGNWTQTVSSAEPPTGRAWWANKSIVARSAFPVLDKDVATTTIEGAKELRLAPLQQDGTRGIVIPPLERALVVEYDEWRALGVNRRGARFLQDCYDIPNTVEVILEPAPRPGQAPAVASLPVLPRSASAGCQGGDYGDNYLDWTHRQVSLPTSAVRKLADQPMQLAFRMFLANSNGVKAGNAPQEVLPLADKAKFSGVGTADDTDLLGPNLGWAVAAPSVWFPVADEAECTVLITKGYKLTYDPDRRRCVLFEDDLGYTDSDSPDVGKVWEARWETRNYVAAGMLRNASATEVGFEPLVEAGWRLVDAVGLANAKPAWDVQALAPPRSGRGTVAEATGQGVDSRLVTPLNLRAAAGNVTLGFDHSFHLSQAGLGLTTPRDRGALSGARVEVSRDGGATWEPVAPIVDTCRGRPVEDKIGYTCGLREQKFNHTFARPVAGLQCRVRTDACVDPADPFARPDGWVPRPGESAHTPLSGPGGDPEGNSAFGVYGLAFSGTTCLDPATATFVVQESSNCNGPEDWQRVRFDLSPWAGQDVLLGFRAWFHTHRFVGNGSDTGAHGAPQRDFWRVDNITVEAPVLDGRPLWLRLRAFSDHDGPGYGWDVLNLSVLGERHQRNLGVRLAEPGPGEPVLPNGTLRAVVANKGQEPLRARGLLAATQLGGPALRNAGFEEPVAGNTSVGWTFASPGVTHGKPKLRAELIQNPQGLDDDDASTKATFTVPADDAWHTVVEWDLGQPTQVAGVWWSSSEPVPSKHGLQLSGALESVNAPGTPGDYQRLLTLTPSEGVNRSALHTFTHTYRFYKLEWRNNVSQLQASLDEFHLVKFTPKNTTTAAEGERSLLFRTNATDPEIRFQQTFTVDPGHWRLAGLVDAENLSAGRNGDVGIRLEGAVDDDGKPNPAVVLPQRPAGEGNARFQGFELNFTVLHEPAAVTLRLHTNRTLLTNPNGFAGKLLLDDLRVEPRPPPGLEPRYTPLLDPGLEQGAASFEVHDGKTGDVGRFNSFTVSYPTRTVVFPRRDATIVGDGSAEISIPVDMTNLVSLDVAVNLTGETRLSADNVTFRLVSPVLPQGGTVGKAPEARTVPPGGRADSAVNAILPPGSRVVLSWGQPIQPPATNNLVVLTMDTATVQAEVRSATVAGVTAPVPAAQVIVPTTRLKVPALSQLTLVNSMVLPPESVQARPSQTLSFAFNHSALATIPASAAVKASSEPEAFRAAGVRTSTNGAGVWKLLVTVKNTDPSPLEGLDGTPLCVDTPPTELPNATVPSGLPGRPSVSGIPPTPGIPSRACDLAAHLEAHNITVDVIATQMVPTATGEAGLASIMEGFRSLVVRSPGRGASDFNLTQDLLLQPGTYRLSGLYATRHLNWSIVSDQDSDAVTSLAPPSTFLHRPCQFFCQTLRVDDLPREIAGFRIKALNVVGEPKLNLSVYDDRNVLLAKNQSFTVKSSSLVEVALKETLLVPQGMREIKVEVKHDTPTAGTAIQLETRGGDEYPHGRLLASGAGADVDLRLEVMGRLDPAGGRGQFVVANGTFATGTRFLPLASSADYHVAQVVDATGTGARRITNVSVNLTLPASSQVREGYVHAQLFEVPPHAEGEVPSPGQPLSEEARVGIRQLPGSTVNVMATFNFTNAFLPPDATRFMVGFRAVGLTLAGKADGADPGNQTAVRLHGHLDPRTSTSEDPVGHEADGYAIQRSADRTGFALATNATGTPLDLSLNVTYRREGAVVLDLLGAQGQPVRLVQPTAEPSMLQGSRNGGVRFVHDVVVPDDGIAENDFPDGVPATLVRLRLRAEQWLGEAVFDDLHLRPLGPPALPFAVDLAPGQSAEVEGKLAGAVPGARYAVQAEAVAVDLEGLPLPEVVLSDNRAMVVPGAALGPGRLVFARAPDGSALLQPVPNSVNLTRPGEVELQFTVRNDGGDEVQLEQADGVVEHPGTGEIVFAGTHAEFRPLPDDLFLQPLEARTFRWRFTPDAALEHGMYVFRATVRQAGLAAPVSAEARFYMGTDFHSHPFGYYWEFKNTTKTYVDDFGDIPRNVEPLPFHNERNFVQWTTDDVHNFAYPPGNACDPLPEGQAADPCVSGGVTYTWAKIGFANLSAYRSVRVAGGGETEFPLCCQGQGAAEGTAFGGMRSPAIPITDMHKPQLLYAERHDFQGVGPVGSVMARLVDPDAIEGLSPVWPFQAEPAGGDFSHRGCVDRNHDHAWVLVRDGLELRSPGYLANKWFLDNVDLAPLLDAARAEAVDLARFDHVQLCFHIEQPTPRFFTKVKDFLVDDVVVTPYGVDVGPSQRIPVTDNVTKTYRLAVRNRGAYTDTYDVRLEDEGGVASRPPPNWRVDLLDAGGLPIRGLTVQPGETRDVLVRVQVDVAPPTLAREGAVDIAVTVVSRTTHFLRSTQHLLFDYAYEDRPNLRIAGMIVNDPELSVDKPRTVDVIVQNTGTVDASDVDLLVVDKMDPSFGVAPVELRGLDLQPLPRFDVAPGEVKIVTANWVPRVAGEHNVTAVLDPLQRLLEYDERDNVLVRPVTVPRAEFPDLLLEATASTTNPSPGDLVAIAIRVTNRGGAPASGVQMSVRAGVTDLLPGEPPHVLPKAIAPGETVELAATWRPAFPGEQTIILRARTFAGVLERLETSGDNVVLLPIQVRSKGLEIAGPEALAVVPGGRGVAELALRNRGDVDDTYRVTLRAPDDWRVDLVGHGEEARLTVGNHSGAGLTLVVEVPRHAEAGPHAVVVRAASENSTELVEHHLAVHVPQRFGLHLRMEPDLLAEPGLAFLPLALQNSGNGVDLVTVRATSLPAGWALEPATLAVEPRSTLRARLNLTLPTTTPEGAYPLAIEAQGSGGALLGHRAMVQVLPAEHLTLALEGVPAVLLPGASAGGAVVVRNAGNVPARADIALRGPEGWPLRLERDVAMLQPGEERSLGLVLTAPVDAARAAGAVVAEAVTGQGGRYAARAPVRPANADLAVASLELLPRGGLREGQVATAQVRVANHGEVAADAAVAVYFDDQLVGFETVPGLAPGAEALVNATFLARRGDHVVLAAVDPALQVGEEDEENNARLAVQRVANPAGFFAVPGPGPWLVLAAAALALALLRRRAVDR